MRRMLFLMLILALMSACAGAEEEFILEARGAVLIEAASGRVLFAHNEREMLPIASTTKVMTCLVALEHASLSERVVASANAHGTPGTSIFLSLGEALTMEEMLYGLMLRSGNDAAIAIAEHVAGTEEAFAEMMNARAALIGADAHFVNAHGLDAEGHQASALAMAQILRAALEIEDFARISATERKIIPWHGNPYDRALVNKNRLLTSYEGATGGKTGFTTRAGRCLVFSAERDGIRLIGAVLNCPAWFDAAEWLLDYGYENYQFEMLYGKGDVVAAVEVAGGRAREVHVIAAETLAFPLAHHEDYELALDISDPVKAPVHAGDVAGYAVVYVGGEEIAKTALLYESDVPANSMEAALRRLIGMWPLLAS
ncbi:MAG: D-alanyl-D-alanine carboxypeptidase family protein [Christensenellales bacterium]|jgi:D-alanyl-D-alanine carboxypeptidase (penicillin-binding protein 5/6)